MDFANTQVKVSPKLNRPGGAHAVSGSKHAGAALLLLVAVIAALPAPLRADMLVDPSTDPGAFASGYSGGWYVGCDYEYGGTAPSDYQCGSYFESNQNYTNTVLQSNLTGAYEGILNLTGVPEADFAYQEVDKYNSATGMYDTPVDFVTFDNAQCITSNCFGPVTFTFTDANGNAAAIYGLTTTIYSWAGFTANVSAYDAEGNLLGVVSFDSVENDQELDLGIFNPTYEATVGALDLDSADIASLVISTVPAPGGVAGAFAVGYTEVSPAPEPRAFVPILLAAAAFFAWRSRKSGTLGVARAGFRRAR